jgi:hypothetical protein
MRLKDALNMRNRQDYCWTGPKSSSAIVLRFAGLRPRLIYAAFGLYAGMSHCLFLHVWNIQVVASMRFIVKLIG